MDNLEVGATTLRIWVGKCDIANGLRGKYTQCPIAQAIKRVFKNKIKSVGVNVLATIVTDKRSYYYKLSKLTLKKITNFDVGGDMKPGYVNLKLLG